MDNAEGISIAMAWGGVLGAPILGYVCQRRFTGRIWRVGALAAILAIWAATSLGVGFVRPELDVITLCLGYLAYCFLAFSCLRIGWKPLRYAAMAATALPIVVGCLLGTFGGFALAMIAGEYVRPPNSVEMLADGSICKTTDWGSAFTDSGYRINLYRPVGPFLERRIARVSVNFNDVAPGQTAAGCTDVAALAR